MPSRQLPGQALPGRNDWGRTGYGGPCPPIGRHRYFFKLYALDAVLPDLRQPTKAQLVDAMQGHVLAEAQVMGTYIRAVGPPRAPDRPSGGERSRRAAVGPTRLRASPGRRQAVGES